MEFFQTTKSNKGHRRTRGQRRTGQQDRRQCDLAVAYCRRKNAGDRRLGDRRAMSGTETFTQINVQSRKHNYGTAQPRTGLFVDTRV